MRVRNLIVGIIVGLAALLYFVSHAGSVETPAGPHASAPSSQP